MITEGTGNLWGKSQDSDDASEEEEEGGAAQYDASANSGSVYAGAAQRLASLLAAS